jgi:molybdenum cofactor cytidylyltransferase
MLPLVSYYQLSCHLSFYHLSFYFKMTGIIILAAGASVRMGSPKQQLPYKGSTLLQHAINEALQTHVAIVIVVLGAGADEIAAGINSPSVIIARNADWQQGMGSSIRTGVAALLQAAPQIEEVLMLLGDQPLVDAPLLEKIMTVKGKAGKRIVACTYGNTIGVPALFDKRYFNDLLALDGETGARKLLQRFKDDMEVVDFPGGATDIDTPEDYQKII